MNSFFCDEIIIKLQGTIKALINEVTFPVGDVTSEFYLLLHPDIISLFLLLIGMAISRNDFIVIALLVTVCILETKNDVEFSVLVSPVGSLYLPSWADNMGLMLDHTF